MPPQVTHSNKLRIEFLVGGAVVAIAVVAILLASMAGSDSTKKKSEPNGSKAQAESPALKLQLGTVTVQSVGPPARLKPPVRKAVLASAQTYVDDAILAPLDGGRVDSGYARMFDRFVKTAATTADRATLTEANTGAVSKPIAATASKVHLDALGDPTGKVALVAATFTMNIKASTATGPLTIGRITELTFAKESDRWVVTAYKVTVRRSINNANTSTTARSGTKGAPA